MSLILLLIVAVAAFNIVAALVMVVNEKRSDIAILRTLGLAPGGVVGAFFTQGTRDRRERRTLLGVRARPAARVQRRDDRTGAREPVRLSRHGSQRLLHHRDSVGSAAAPGRARSSVTPSCSPCSPRSTPPPRRGHAPGRGAAVRVMRGGMPYELMIGRRYLRSSGNRFLSLHFGDLDAGRGDRRGGADRRPLGHERLRARAAQPHPRAWPTRRSGFGEGRLRLAGDRAPTTLGQPASSRSRPSSKARHADRRGERSVGRGRARRAAGVEERRVSAVRAAQLGRDSSALQPGSYRIVLGADSPGKLEVARGDTVVVVIAQGNVTPAGVVPRLRRFAVAGMFAAGMYEFDQGLRSSTCRTRRVCSGLATASRDCARDSTTRCRGAEGPREVAGPCGGRYYVSDWTRRQAQFLPFDRAHEADDVLHPAARGRGRGLQHRLDAGDGR